MAAIAARPASTAASFAALAASAEIKSAAASRRSAMSASRVKAGEAGSKLRGRGAVSGGVVEGPTRRVWHRI